MIWTILKNYTLGFDDFAERARQFSLDHAHEVTGVSVQEIKDLALLMVNNKAVAIRTGVALERTANGGDAVRAIASFQHLLGLGGCRVEAYFNIHKAPFRLIAMR